MKRKVLAYITRNNNTELLVFLHKYHPEAGWQVPAGTVEDNEELTAALFREIEEESGLNQFTLIRQLTSEPFYVESKAEWQQVNVFHLQASDNLPESWLYIVKAGEEDKGLHFEYSWLTLTKAQAALIDHQGHWLDKIND